MNCALYARFSTELQSRASTEDQLRLCRIRAETEGFKIVVEHADEGVSGSIPIASRPGGNALLADAMAGRFQILLIESLDRLSRDTVESETIIRRLEYRGIRIIGISDGYDSTSKARKLNRGLRGLINEVYLDDLRAKTHRGLSGVVARGLHAGGLPYGYRTISLGEGKGHRLEIREDQAAIVRKIFDWHLSGWGPARIAAKLNADGIAGPRGVTWAVSAIYGNRKKGCGILANELYVGRYIWNRSQWMKDPDTGTRRRIDRPQSEWQRRDEPKLAIITKPVWDAAQARMEAPSAKGGMKGRSKKPTTLLGGLMTCAECGGSIIAINAERYGCATRKDRGLSVCSGVYFRKDIAEERILAGLRAELLEPLAIAEVQAAVRAILEQKAMPADHSGRLAEIDGEIKRLVEAIAMIGVSPALAAKLKTAEAEKARLQALQSPAIAIKDIPNIGDRYRRLLQDLAGVLKSDIDRSRAILSELLGSVRVSKEVEGIYAVMETRTQMLLKQASGYPEMVAGIGFKNRIRIDK